LILSLSPNALMRRVPYGKVARRMNNASRTLVIVNPVAAAARRRWPEIKAALAHHNVRFDLHETTNAGDAETAARAALKADYETICVVGGDGTLSEAANGFFEWNAADARVDVQFFPAPVNTKAALAILPAGTGDDLARGLTNTREPLGAWIKRLIAHCRRDPQGETTTRLIDVIAARTVNSAHAFVYLNVATIGLGAEVARRVAAQSNLMRRLSGEARFTAAALVALAAWRERLVRVNLDEDRVFECNSNLLAVANGIYAGGGMMFAPNARLDDGQLDFLMACDISRARILRELPRIRSGKHLRNSKVSYAKAARVHIETFAPADALLIEADGNLRGHTPAEFRVMPRALRVVI
jgi:YegS/Rv2252/BmrU family lipid kinase